MRKTIIFFFLILFFSNNAYSSSCESEFSKKEARTELDSILKDKLKGILKIALASDKLSFEERVVIAVSVGNNQIKEELRSYVQFIARDVPPHQQGFMLESLGRIEEEIRAYILKGLLKKNPEPDIQEIIAESAGELGGKWGASVLKYMLEMPFDLSPLARSTIIRSAVKIGKEEGAGVLTEMLENDQHSFEERSDIAYSAGMSGEAGESMLKDLLEKNQLSSEAQSAVAYVVREFQKPEKGEVLDRTLFDRWLKEMIRSALKDWLEKDISPEMQVALAEFAGKNQTEEELRASTITKQLYKGVPPHQRDFSIESLVRIGGEIKAVLLKGLLTKNPEFYIQEIIARSAGKLGGEEGAGVLTEMLENDQHSFEERSTIAYSAGMSGEAGKSMLKDLLEKNQLSSEAQSAVAYAASRIEYKTGGMSLLN